MLTIQDGFAICYDEKPVTTAPSLFDLQANERPRKEENKPRKAKAKAADFQMSLF